MSRGCSQNPHCLLSALVQGLKSLTCLTSSMGYSFYSLSTLSSATFSHTLFQFWLFGTVLYIHFSEYLFLFLEGSVFYNVYFSLASPLFIYQLNFNVLRKMFLDSLVYILTVLNDCHLNFYLHYFAFFV